MTTLENIVEMTNHHVRSIDPDAMLIDAIASMCEHHVRALLVGELTEPVGIVSERDVLERAVLIRLDPSVTKVKDVMTSPLVWLPVDCTAPEALEFLRVRHLHQVPVMSEEAVIGIVSATDLLRWARRSTEVEIQSLTEYCSRRYPS